MYLIVLILILVILIQLNSLTLEKFMTTEVISKSKGIVDPLPSNVYFSSIKDIKPVKQPIEIEFNMLKKGLKGFINNESLTPENFSLTNSNDVNMDSQIEYVILRTFTKYVNKNIKNRNYNPSETIKSDITTIAPEIYKFSIFFVLFEKTTSFSIPITISGNINNTKGIINFKTINYNFTQKQSNIKARNELTNDFRIKNSLHLLPPYLSDEPILMSEKEFKDAYKKLKVKKEEQDSYQCFGIPSNTAIDRDGCIQQGGIWDKSVILPEECPYYQRNKHYPNKRGGDKGGYCELPSGMQRVGYRYYSADPEHKPFCYNCKSELELKSTIGKCCEEQKDNNKYPKLNGIPDYKFPGDSYDRLSNKGLLNNKGLSVT